jgi:hypothetical protein
MELTDSLKKLLSETALQLKGAAKRRFMAQTVLELGYGGQTLAAQELGSKSVLSEHKYYSIAKDCYLGKHSGV